MYLLLPQYLHVTLVLLLDRMDDTLVLLLDRMDDTLVLLLDLMDQKSYPIQVCTKFRNTFDTNGHQNVVMKSFLSFKVFGWTHVSFYGVTGTPVLDF